MNATSFSKKVNFRVLNEVMSGLLVEKRPDDVIVMFVNDAARQTVNDWAEQIQSLYQTYCADNHHLRLLYMFDSYVMPTPYLIKRAIGVLNARPPELVISAAMTVQNQNIAMGITHIMKRIHYAKHIHLVKSAEEGLFWLDERHRKYQQGSTLET